MRNGFSIIIFSNSCSPNSFLLSTIYYCLASPPLPLLGQKERLQKQHVDTITELSRASRAIHQQPIN